MRAAAALLLVPGLLVAADRLPRLPKDLSLPKSADSPGVVVFRHVSHVDPSRPDCTPCHPALFRILKTPASTRPVIRHADMEKGRACGACHDGKSASDLTDCAKCHRTE